MCRKIKKFFKKLFKKPEIVTLEEPDNIIEFSAYSHFRLKYNSEKEMYEKVLEYEDRDLD